MKVLVTKANSDYWYKVKEFNTMEDIQKFVEECRHRIIIRKNPYTDNYNFEFWENMKPEDISIIKKCPLHIIIYNSWIE